MLQTTTQRIALAAYWTCVLALFVALRLNLSDVQLNIDELIPVKVSQAMSARGALDPNWRFGDLPWFWNGDQYNFYFYNIVAHGVLKVGSWFGASALPALRFANVIFQLAALAFSIDALRRLGVGAFGLALAGTLLAVAPGPVQDAGMARCESLIYLLVALQLWVLTLPLPEVRRAFLFGVLLGVGCAIKVTYVEMALLLLATWATWWREPRRWLAAAGAAAGGTVLGFAAAAPYAVIHPGVFMSGLAALSEGYTGGIPPHSMPQFNVARQAVWIGSYFLQLYGPLLLAAFAAPFWLRGRPRALAAGGVVLWVLVFVYFIGKPVFFERNFAHTLIPLLLAAALFVAALRHAYLRIPVALVLVLWMGYWSAQIAAATHDRESAVARFEAANGLNPSERLPFDASVDRKVPARCETISLIDHNDPWTANFLVQLQAQGFVPIARYRGRFSRLVTSTLHTYLDSDVHYLRCPDPKR